MSTEDFSVADSTLCNSVFTKFVETVIHWIRLVGILGQFQPRESGCVL